MTANMLVITPIFWSLWYYWWLYQYLFR